MKNKDMESMSAAAAGAKEKMRIMVAIDDSEDSFYALEWVLDNLLTNGINGDDQYMLTIIHVIEPFPHFVFPGAHAMFPTTSIIQSVNKVQEENASAILAHAVRVCAERMFNAKGIVLEGDPKEMICDASEQMQIDLIVVGSRGLGKIKRAFIGSVSDYVTHHAKCPVLIVKPPTSKK